MNPMTMVAGTTTKMIGVMIAATAVSSRLGSNIGGWASTRTSPPNASAATTSWAAAIVPTTFRRYGRTAEKATAPNAIPNRNRPRIRVKT